MSRHRRATWLTRWRTRRDTRAALILADADVTVIMPSARGVVDHAADCLTLGRCPSCRSVLLPAAGRGVLGGDCYAPGCPPAPVRWTLAGGHLVVEALPRH